MTPSCPFTSDSVKKEMMKFVCRGYEGHAPYDPIEYWGTIDSGLGKSYAPILCKKCHSVVYLKTSELDYTTLDFRATPRYP
jgi:hypothetical protein